MSHRLAAGDNSFEKSGAAGFYHERYKVEMVVNLDDIDHLPRIATLVGMVHNINQAALIDGGDDTIE